MSPTLLSRALVALAAAFLVTASPLDAQSSRKDDQLEAPEVLKLTLQGVKAVEKGDLRNSISIEESHCKSFLLRALCLITKANAVYKHNFLDRGELKRDVLRIRVFYWKRGYREATVDTVVARRAGGVHVTIRVHEGQPTIVRRIAVGPPTPTLSARDIQRSVSLRAGRPLNLLMLDSSLVSLRNKLWERGYADAIVRVDTVAISDSARSADVRISIDPRWKATVAEIRVTGNEVITERTIRNSLTLNEGDLFRRSDVLESQRNLYESGLFRHASILIPPQGDSSKIVEVTVREAPLREARAGTGFNSVDFVQVEGRFRHYNLFGGARRLDVQGAVGNLFAATLNNRFIFRNPFENIGVDDRSPFELPTWHTSADIQQPWFQNPRNTLALGLFAHRRMSPGVFVDRGMGTSMTFTREVAIRTPVSANYRFELTRVEAGDLYFCVYYGICDTPTIESQRSRQRLSPLSLTGSVDRTNEAFSPSAGILGRFELEHASAATVSDYRYNRGAIDLASYYRVGRKNVLAIHGRAGIVRPIGSTASALDVEGDVLHPRKRFYAGGSQSVRGYGENQLGPRALTIPSSKLATLQGCDLSSAASLALCNPNGATVRDSAGTLVPGDILPERDFAPRPLGGTSVLEGNVEFRFPIWRALGGVAFVDGALVGKGGLASLSQGAGAVTPGIGGRYKSPVGPIRVDMAYNPGPTEDLDVYTDFVDADRRRRIVRLQTPRQYDPFRDSNGFRALLDHITFHFSIGQAF